MKMNQLTTRRSFLASSLAAGTLAFISKSQSEDVKAEAYIPFRAITKAPKSHWFGYYDKAQFDPTDRYVLGAQVGFNDRSPKPDDAIQLGTIDLQDGDRWSQFDETTAWCWQQGCMLQWLPQSERSVIFNVRNKNGYGSIIHDLKTGKMRKLPHPIYALSPTGKQAVSLNFARLGTTRPGYGYNGIADPHAEEFHPDNDGIYVVDLESGEAKLIVTLDRIAKFRHDDSMDKGIHWFNHLLFSPDGSRFIFLHRWRTIRNGRKTWFTRMFTVDPDGDNLHCVADHEMVSHFIWKNPHQILAWSKEPESGNRFHLYDDQSGTVAVIGEGILTQDGHCTYSPDKQWILVDTYPDKQRMQTLMLFRPSDNHLVKLGKFYLTPDQTGEMRCDLHPRWSRNGKTVCIDSLHSGQRQIYILDVSEYTA